jgi:hypothetical protein
MENEEKMLTPEESLQLITRTIEGIKENFKQDNYYFILWGWIVSIASILQFAMIRILIIMNNPELIKLYSWLLWGILFAFGIALQFNHIRRKIASKTKSQLGKFFKILWQCSGIALVLAVIISQKLHVFPNPFVLTIAGLATLISGRLINYKPLIFGGIAFFIFAVAASFITNEYQLLIGTAAIITGYLVPGYLLKNTKE